MGILKEGESLDSLEYKGLKIIQSAGLYRFTSDAVLLANSVAARRGGRAVDLGSGSGVVGTLIAAKTGARVIGVEIQEALFDTAVRSAELNGMTDSLTFLNLDIRKIFLTEKNNAGTDGITKSEKTETDGGIETTGTNGTIEGTQINNATKNETDGITKSEKTKTNGTNGGIKAEIKNGIKDGAKANGKTKNEAAENGADAALCELRRGGFDIVVTNPPYGKKACAAGIKNESARIARTEDKITLDEIVSAAARLLRFGGKFYIVVKTPRLFETTYLMTKYGIEPKELTLVLPARKKPPDVCIVRGVRGGKTGLKINEPLVVFDENGEYTKEVKKMYDISG
ncbi:MAG: hypothetical protein LBP62_00665 [Clostridiales bacterium]|jgi:tRNA1(Val) A37 N6-methylase TrmN6|nr:hypothetical protein [Clostridiales bacterium]